MVCSEMSSDECGGIVVLETMVAERRAKVWSTALTDLGGDGDR